MTVGDEIDAVLADGLRTLGAITKALPRVPPTTIKKTLYREKNGRYVNPAHGRWALAKPATVEQPKATPKAPKTVTENKPGPGKKKTGAITPATPLTAALELYRKWLYLSNDLQVIAALGAVAANLLPGDPCWLLFVGPAASGKTEVIAPLGKLPYVHLAATLTEPALLSGTPTKERTEDATGGLLRQIGDFGIILARDFSGILSLHRDARAATFAALREVYDGEWSRPIGAGGGRVLSWRGKCGFLGAATPSIDSYYEVMGALGERFMLYRVKVDDPKAQATRRLGNRGHEGQMRAELVEAVARCLDGIGPNTSPRELDPAEIEDLVGLAQFTVEARSPVERSGYNKTVQVFPESESPARLVGGLAALLAGCEAVGASTDNAWKVVTKVAWDCLPNIRRRLLEGLWTLETEADPARAEWTAQGSEIESLARLTGLPITTVRYYLEDLEMLGLCESKKGTRGASGSPARYWLAPKIKANWPRFPDPES